MGTRKIPETSLDTRRTSDPDSSRTNSRITDEIAKPPLFQSATRHRRQMSTQRKALTTHTIQLREREWKPEPRKKHRTKKERKHSPLSLDDVLDHQQTTALQDVLDVLHFDGFRIHEIEFGISETKFFGAIRSHRSDHLTSGSTSIRQCDFLKGTETRHHLR